MAIQHALEPTLVTTLLAAAHRVDVRRSTKHNGFFVIRIRPTFAPGPTVVVNGLSAIVTSSQQPSQPGLTAP